MKSISLAVALTALIAFATGAQAEGVRAKGRLGVNMTATGAPQVLRVAPNSPAAKAGLRVGDRIVGVNEEGVKTTDDVIRLVSAHKPGTKLEIIFERNGLQGDVMVTISSELDAFNAPQVIPASTTPASNINRNPAWPAGYQPSEVESLPYQG